MLRISRVRGRRSPSNRVLSDGVTRRCCTRSSMWHHAPPKTSTRPHSPHPHRPATPPRSCDCNIRRTERSGGILPRPSTRVANSPIHVNDNLQYVTEMTAQKNGTMWCGKVRTGMGWYSKTVSRVSKKIWYLNPGLKTEFSKHHLKTLNLVWSFKPGLKPKLETTILTWNPNPNLCSKSKLENRTLIWNPNSDLKP